jgi:hypothetical protein
MWFVINFVGALLLLTSPAFADSCVFSLMPPYALKSDAVNWEMHIASGKTCTKGHPAGWRRDQSRAAPSNDHSDTATHQRDFIVTGPSSSRLSLRQTAPLPTATRKPLKPRRRHSRAIGSVPTEAEPSRPDGVGLVRPA